MRVLVERTHVRLRVAEPGDVEFLAGLASRSDVMPFISVLSALTEAEVRSEVERLSAKPEEGGRVVVEGRPLGDGAPWARIGQLAWRVVHRPSRIVWLHEVMLVPEARGRGLALLAVQLATSYLIRGAGYHRIQLEVLDYNERALRLFERAGFVREGVKRKAYWRCGGWRDGIMFGLVEEDLEAPDPRG